MCQTFHSAVGSIHKSLCDMSLLPSACCMAAPEKEGFHVFGGGYGHGLGMSQNGANGMAKAGMGYVEILKEFYHDIAIENIYNGD